MTEVSLPSGVAVDLLVLAEAVDQARDIGSEALPDLVELDAGLLDGVVEIGRCDQRTVVAGIDEEPSDGDRMLDELLPGLLPVLAQVDASSEPESGGGEVGVGPGLDSRGELGHVNGDATSESLLSQFPLARFPQIAGGRVTSRLHLEASASLEEPPDR